MMPRIRQKPLNSLLPLGRSELAGLSRALLEALGLSGRSFELELLNDAAMARLNQAFLGLPGPTNVLSFPAQGQPDYLGEIALGVETVWRESVLYGQDPRAHFCRMLCHGLLHLSGLDHGPEMEEQGERALARLAALDF